MGVTCRCCGQPDVVPAPGVPPWRGPSCSGDPHTHTWRPRKSWEQLEEAAAQARWRQSAGLNVLTAKW